MRLFYLILFLTSYFVGYSQDIDTVKCWQLNNRLNWSDFKGEIPKDKIALNIMAVCPHEIIVKPLRNNGFLSFDIRVLFLKKQAWTKDTSEYTLLHEQLHFDIAELHARKLRKAIAQIKPSFDLNSYRGIIESHLAANDKMQREYDTLTAHGIYSSIQVEWNTKIEKELDLLKEYTTTVGDCKN